MPNGVERFVRAKHRYVLFVYSARKGGFPAETLSFCPLNRAFFIWHASCGTGDIGLCIKQPS